MNGGGAFLPTLWSVVLRAKDPKDSHRRTALNRLCEGYWKPVYAYLLRKGFAVEDARDLTQGFFAHFLEKDLLERVEPGRGRFRSYLLAVLENYLANERRRARAEKRGGGAHPRPFDFARAETEVCPEPPDPSTPEDVFHRTWGLSVLHEAFEALGREFGERGMNLHFEVVCSHLRAAEARASYEQMAGRLGVPVTDVTNLIHRSKRRLRELIRSVLRETVDSEAEVDQELRDLFAAL